MTHKDTLTQRLEDTKAKIKENSADKMLADFLIKELLSAYGQLEHEPTLAHIALKDIEKELKGDTFHMAVMKDGTCVYKVYGGYTIICDGRMESLSNTIKEYIKYSEAESEMSDEEKESYELTMSAIRFVLSAPMYAFADSGLTFDLARTIVEYLVSLQNEAENAELPIDYAKDNADHLDEITAMDEILEKV